MGFHKRFITKEGLLSNYKHSGLSGVKGYFSADALFIQDEFSEKVLELLNESKDAELEEMLDLELIENKNEIY